MTPPKPKQADFDDWDPVAFEAGIDRAREQAEAAAHFVASARERPDLQRYGRLGDLVFYLATLDYEIKVWIRTAIEHDQDPYIWGKYLALLLNECLSGVPGALSRAVAEMEAALGSLDGSEGPDSVADGDADTDEVEAQIERYRLAREAFNTAVRPLKSNKRAMSYLKEVRSGVAAHHFARGHSVTPSIEWMRGSAAMRREAVPPNEHPLVVHAYTVGMAIHSAVEEIFPGGSFGQPEAPDE